MVVPSIVLAAVLGFILVEHEREVYREGAIDRNRAFMIAVDSEIRGHMLSLNALAASKNLASGDLRAFHDEAIRIHKSQPDWQRIHLMTPSGQQVLNSSRPFGTKLPISKEMVTVGRVVSTGLPAVGGIFQSQLNGELSVPVRVPIHQNGELRYILTAVIKPESFGRLIEAQNLPASWVNGIVDENGRFVARLPYRPPGELGSAAFRAATAHSTEGWYRGLTVDGKDSYTAYKTSEFTHWSAGFAIPAAEVNAAAWRAAGLVAIGTLLLVLCAIPFANWVSRRIASPIAELEEAARAMGAGTMPSGTTAHSEIREVREVGQAIIDAAIAIRDRQQLLERERLALKAADRAKDEFLAMLGHELRNPLSAVSNAASALDRPVLPLENRLEAQAVIVRQTAQLTRLVNDLLDVGRVVAGKIELERAPVELTNVAAAAVAAVRATNSGAAPQISADYTESVVVQGDPARLEQIITNLLSNAVTHTPTTGSIDVCIVKEADFAVLRVTDTGAGFSDEDREAMFGLFYQAESALHRKGGLGIGLTLVKRLVAMHGGSVSAFSAGHGKGSTFTVRLPLSNATDTAAAREEPATAAQSLKVLVIDDNEDVRTSMRLLLESAGHDVYVADSGASGLAAAGRMSPHVSLIDIGMPGMDGYEVARQMRRTSINGGDRYLIAMTGYGLPDDVRLAREAGFDEHLTKPADWDVLNALLAKAAGRNSAEVERRSGNAF
ncbi:MAG: hybrid sensor histidine kinase/response regulator [Betaproteobacteria bacterium]|nr:hybrid sensor histidine kinase/response regulator [Betaproteobacteria bacterium]